MAAHFAFKLFSFHYALVLCRLLGKAKPKKCWSFLFFSPPCVCKLHSLLNSYFGFWRGTFSPTFTTDSLLAFSCFATNRQVTKDASFSARIERFTTGFSQKSNSAAAQIHQSLFYGGFAFLFLLLGASFSSPPRAICFHAMKISGLR